MPIGEDLAHPVEDVRHVARLAPSRRLALQGGQLRAQGAPAALALMKSGHEGGEIPTGGDRRREPRQFGLQPRQLRTQRGEALGSVT